MTDYARPFCTSCYALESDSPPVLTAYKIMDLVESAGTLPLSITETLLDRASSLIQEAYAPIEHNLGAAQEQFDNDNQVSEAT